MWNFSLFPLPLLLHSLSGWHLPDNSGLSCHTHFSCWDEAPCRPSTLCSVESEWFCLAGGACEEEFVIADILYWRWKDVSLTLYQTDYCPSTQSAGHPLLIWWLWCGWFAWSIVGPVLHRDPFNWIAFYGTFLLEATYLIQNVFLFCFPGGKRHLGFLSYPDCSKVMNFEPHCLQKCIPYNLVNTFIIILRKYQL